MPSDPTDLAGELIQDILSGKLQNKEEVHRAKLRLSKKYALNSIPSDAQILEYALSLSDDTYAQVLPLLRTKPMRTISGVAPVAVMTSPAPCPHGKCIYCPGGVEQGTAQSYTGYEPASLRALAHNFDPYEQTRARLRQLDSIGHPIDKVDLILMGGTFTARPEEYQNWFIKRCFDALNNGLNARSLAHAQSVNEWRRVGISKCVGLTIETRPDWCRASHVDRILEQGGTRVELGVQSVYNDVLLAVERGHGVEDTIEATRLLKDAGLKVCYHLMPGLPRSSRARDLEMFREVFERAEFKPDMIKIYPALVVKGTKLYELWKRGDYAALSTAEAVKLIAEAKRYIPPWVRVQRIQRDIPVQHIEAGVDKGNLRQLVHAYLKRKKLKCKCIRCREVGHTMLKGLEPRDEHIKLLTHTYEASGGWEAFISYEEIKNHILIGYARLRLPSENAHRRELKSGNVALLRELRVTGAQVPLSERPVRGPEWQHRGYGELLVSACETYAQDTWDARKLFIRSGIGARDYYRRLGYRKYGAYMFKKIIC